MSLRFIARTRPMGPIEPLNKSLSSIATGFPTPERDTMPLYWVLAQSSA